MALVRETFGTYKRHLVSFLLLSFGMALLNSLNPLLSAHSLSLPLSISSLLLLLKTAIYFLLMISVGCVVTIAMIRIALPSAEPISVGNALRFGLSRFASYTWLLTLQSLVFVAALPLFVLPAIYLALLYAFAYVALIDDRGSGIDTMIISQGYVKGRWWAIFGRSLAFALLIGIPILILSSLTHTFFKLPELLKNGIDLLVSMFLMPLNSIFMVTLYTHMKRLGGEPLPSATGSRSFIVILAWIGVAFIMLGLMVAIFGLIISTTGTYNFDLKSPF